MGSISRFVPPCFRPAAIASTPEQTVKDDEMLRERRPAIEYERSFPAAPTQSDPSEHTLPRMRQTPLPSCSPSPIVLRGGA